jgi:hypothetical protein
MQTKKKKNYFVEQKYTLFDEAMNEFSKNKNKKNPINAENINQILDRHFMKLDLIKFNLFGEDFENYGNLVINGQTYYPCKLNLDYLANQSKDIAQEDLNVNMEILDSLKKAEIPKLDNNRNCSSMKNRKTTSEKSKLLYRNIPKIILKNKSCENIESKNGIIKLPKLKKKNNIRSPNKKFFLQNNFYQTMTSQNRKNFINKRKYFIKRHGDAQGLKKKLDVIERSIKNIDKEIVNNGLINEEKIPQFQYRYKYLESKFNV